MASKPQKIELNAQARSITGSKVKHLREEGILPAVLYGKGQESLNLQVPLKEFEKVLKMAGESTLVYVNVAGQTYPTIIHDVSRDPMDNFPTHADFYKVNLSEKIKTKVPVVFEGESPAVKSLGGIFVRNINEIEVEALPQDLPHEIKISIAGMENLKDQIQIKDIKLPNGVTIEASPEDIIALIQEPLSEEELKKALEGEEVKEVEIIGKEEKEEEVAEEGEETPAPAKEEKKEE